MSDTSSGGILALIGAAATFGALTLATPSSETTPRLPARVVSFHWHRWVHNDKGGVAHTGSGQRVFWPGWDQKAIMAAVKAEGRNTDSRGWAPRNSSERYWVVDQFGEEHEIDLSEWAGLFRGDLVPD